MCIRDRYEAFNTSGGLGTLCETWAGKVRNLDYKTVRYPGPVSYTHLDVYKRQSPSCLAASAASKVRRGMSRGS